MTAPFKFSIRLNNDLAVSDYVCLARACEQSGFDQFWVSNDLFLKSSPVILAALASETERLGLGTCILNPYTIDPSEIAMMAATLDELSGNRFHLGIAAGARDFMKWVGIEHRTPLAAVRESVEVIRALLSGEHAALDGEYLKWSDESYLRFRASRTTPIYIGALGPKMLRLAGEIGDGVLPLLFPPEHYFTVGPLLEEGARARGDPEMEAVPAELARACEQSGFDQFWVSNDLFLKSSPVILAALASETERLGLGTCILNPYTNKSDTGN